MIRDMANTLHPSKSVFLWSRRPGGRGVAWLMRLLLALCVLSAPPAMATTPTIGSAIATEDGRRIARIGILAFREKEAVLARWQPLADYLNGLVPDAHFVLAAYSNREMDNAVATGDVDFVLIQPSHYVRLTYTHGLSSPLATLVNHEGRVAVSHFGGVIFTRADRADINRIVDLRQRRIAAVDTAGLGGFQMQALELIEAGVAVPDQISLLVTDQPQDRVVQAVLDGRADAGFVRTGLLESLAESGALDIEKVKLIDPRTHAGFPFIASTRLYPEWPFAAMRHVEPDLARQVAAALLALPHAGEVARKMRIAGFTIPGDYRSIDQLLRALRQPPFDQAPTFTLLEVWNRWLPLWLGLIGLIGTVLLFTVFRLASRNRELLSTQRELQVSHDKVRKLGRAVEQSPESIVITDLDGRIAYVNQSFERNTGYSAAEVLGRNPRFLQSGRTPRSVFDDMWDKLRSGRIWHGELINRRKDGSEFVETATLSPIQDEHGEIYSYLAVKQDITERKQVESRIHQLAFYDHLTGLPNRALLRDRLVALLSAPERAGSHVLMLLNVDRFKFINDARGHRIGDALLRTLAEHLESSLRDDDLVARMAADEFALLLPALGDGTAEAGSRALEIAQTVHAQVSRPQEVHGEQISITVSIGIAAFDSDGTTEPEGVLRCADMALHRAKDGGGNQSAIFEASMGEVVAQSFRIEGDLREALRQAALQLYLQPQYGADGGLYGAEVLLRWPHPTQGMIPPSLFIPIAEQSDLIVELGEFTLVQACRILAQCSADGFPLHLSVNLSPRHFRRNAFAGWLKGVLAETGADPTHLTLEVTEGLFIDNLDEIASRMHELSHLGIHFSIDDFGTGYSSLAYLKRLPIRELKIDKTFIQDAPEDPDDAALVETILAVAERLHLTVVAEGVETEAQARFLELRGRIVQQGYLHGRPEPAEAWLARWNCAQPH